MEAKNVKKVRRTVKFATLTFALRIVNGDSGVIGPLALKPAVQGVKEERGKF
jgi:hypothetical protein